MLADRTCKDRGCHDIRIGNGSEWCFCVNASATHSCKSPLSSASSSLCLPDARRFPRLGRGAIVPDQTEHEVLHSGRTGTMAPLTSLGNRRASGKHRLELADDNGDFHECVAEAFTQKHHSDPLPIRISWQPRSLQVRSASMALEHDARSVGQCAAARKIEPRTLT